MFSQSYDKGGEIYVSVTDNRQLLPHSGSLIKRGEPEEIIKKFKKYNQRYYLQEGGFMNKTSLVVGIAFVFIVGIAALGVVYAASQNMTSQPVGSAMSNQPVMAQSTADQPVSLASVSVKEFTLSASNYSYSSNSIRVNKGDTVKITLKNDEGMHDLVIDEYNVRTKLLNSGEEETIIFTADKTGTFEFYCSVGKHREMGMKGMLTVM